MATSKPASAGTRGVCSTSSAPTREIILDAAERLFSARGVDGVAVRDLARELGLTPSSLYNHFPSKQALYEAVLERGLRPIVDLVAAAWHPGTLQPDRMRSTVDGLITHLAAHPRLARLLQRAMLEESGNVLALIERWVTPLYDRGMAVIRETAFEAGWDSDELPHLGLGLAGMVFAYFTNSATLKALTGSTHDPLAPDALEVQRRFLEKAIYRLLGPASPRASRKKKR